MAAGCIQIEAGYHTYRCKADTMSAKSSGEEGKRRDLGRKGDGRGEAEMWSIGRSEEHTSELQSRPHISYAVFCLKKKKEPPPTTRTTTKTEHK